MPVIRARFKDLAPNGRPSRGWLTSRSNAPRLDTTLRRMCPCALAGRVQTAARLDYVLFATAFVCTWLALVGMAKPRLALVALACWLGHHASVEAFANTAHLEVLELAFICGALLLLVRGHPRAAGAGIGLAAAT